MLMSDYNTIKTGVSFYMQKSVFKCKNNANAADAKGMSDSEQWHNHFTLYVI